MTFRFQSVAQVSKYIWGNFNKVLHKLVKHVKGMHKCQFNWKQWSKTHTCACSTTPSHNSCFESHIPLFA